MSLHLKFALNLEKLADELIDAVSACWTNPFVCPVVVFPDPKLEQWFRLRWVQKKGALANFNSMMIDRFLMEILVGDDESKKKLSSDMLQSVILAYLYDKDEKGEPNYRSLGDEVVCYLEVNGKLDENHIFDLSLRMASLFLEYETSRPSGFALTRGGKVDSEGKAVGILDCWKQGDLKDFFNGSNREKWQRTLYSKIFHEQDGKPSLLTKVFEATKADYLTIPFLFKTCKKFHCEQFSNEGKTQPVFIFGLSGMGQFYRVILQKFAEEHDVFAFIQNPCMDFWEDISSRGKYHSWKKAGDRWSDAQGNLPDSVKQRLHVSFSQKNVDELENAIDSEEGIDAENENALLCNWGRSGRDNIKLWCQATNYDFEFEGEPIRSETENKGAHPASLLQQVQSMIASRQNSSLKLLEKFEQNIEENGENNKAGFAKDSNFSLTSAPTREREIQVLHSRICKLLSECDKDGNPLNRISDILVFSPDLDNYRTAIYQAFDQTSKEGLHIPFSIVDSPAKASLTANALAQLCALLDPEVQTINRPAFFLLVRNPIVQKTRAITDEDVEAWENWIENINIYRDREDAQSDWKRGLRRLLLSRFTDEDFASEALQNGEIRPYSDISSSNSKSLCKFADAIDELEEWINLAKNNKAATKEILDSVNDKLSNWISLPYAPDGFAGETIVYNQICKGFEILNYQFDAGRTEISWPCIIQTLNCAAESTEYSCGNLFVNGITFAKFIPNRIIPVKHVFFIGAGSSDFPGNIQKNTLDLRNTVAAWPGDDSPVAKKRYAFLCQLMSTTESFHISYVNKNIAKDEDLYPTSIVSDIRNFLKNAIKKSAFEKYGKDAETWIENHKDSIKKIWPEIETPLDEKRPYSELFTPKEWRNRATYDGMVNPTDNESDARKHTRFRWQWMDLKEEGYKETPSYPERVRFRDLQKYLEDPFQHRISQLLNVEENETDVDPEKEYFEPIDFDNLDRSILVNSMVDASITKNNENYNKLLKDLKLSGNLPDGDYGEQLLKNNASKSKHVIDQMSATDADSPANAPENWSNKEKFELTVHQEIGGEEFRWILSGTLPWCNSEKNHLITITSTKPISPSDKPNFKQSKYLQTYIAALALIAQKNASENQTVNISIYSSDADAKKPAEASVTMNSEQAKQKIKKIYNAAFVENFSCAVPADLLDKEYTEFSKYASDLSSVWKFFSKKNIFDKQKDVGFADTNNFSESWKEARNHQKNLITMSIVKKEGK